MPTLALNINEEILKRFSRLVEQNRLAHAYLFTGPKNVGKTATALALAKLLICSQKTKDGYFCDNCGACIKVNKNQHPDVHLIVPEEGGSIQIEQIRNMLSSIKLRPFEAPKKIFILQSVEHLTPEAANALLKTLEEPSVNSLLVLTTSILERNLDTIISRCHVTYFYPLSYAKLASALKKDYHVEDSTAHFLARFSEGSLGRAKHYQDEKIVDLKNALVDEFIFSPDVQDFSKQLLKDKGKAREFLRLLLGWVHDVMLLKQGSNEAHVIHVDRIKDLSQFANQHSFESLEDIYLEVVKTIRTLDENLNVLVPLLIVKEKLSAAFAR